MIKKILLIFVFIFSLGSAFALDSPKVNTEFFTRFNDPYLEKYITEALQNNHDLKKAQQVVEQYRQQTKISFGQELPSMSVKADYLGLHIPRLDNFKLSQNAFVLPFFVNYEPDFLLKNRDKTKSTKKAYEAVKEEERGIYISLLSDVASAYINILQYDDLIEKQSILCAIAREDLYRMNKKLDRGVIDTNTLNTARQTLENEKNTLNDLEKQRTALLNNFAVLIGVSPEQICNIKRAKLSDFEYQGQIPCEVKSDVIFSRPDVLNAEKQLEKAKIDVRVARKEFLPTFNVTGIWAFNTIAPGAFFSWQSSLAALLAGASMDIFKGGQKVANLKLQKAKYQELFENYRQTDLNAVKEVNTSLCMVKYDTTVDNNLNNILKYETENFINNQKKYERGIISFPELLSANKKLVNIKQNKARSKTTRLINYITLYKALGGVL